MNTNEAQALLDNGEHAFIDQKWDEALEFFDQVLRKEPENSRAFERTKDILGLKGQLSALEEFISHRARVLISIRNYPEAVHMLERVLKLRPDNYLARLMIAEIYTEQNERETAFEHFIHWGRIYKEKKMPEQAILFLRNALDLKPTNVDITGEMAAILLELKRTDEAADLYRQLAEEFLKISRPREAMTALTTAQAFKGGCFSNILNADYLLALSEDGALPLKGYLKVDYDAIGLLTDAARSRMEKKNHHGAAALYHEILTFAPDHGSTHEHLGELYLQEKDYTRALRHLMAAAEKYQAQGKKEKALELCEKVLRVDASHSAALVKLKGLKKT